LRLTPADTTIRSGGPGGMETAMNASAPSEFLAPGTVLEGIYQIIRREWFAVLLTGGSQGDPCMPLPTPVINYAKDR
jgi:hypothetical protein